MSNSSTNFTDLTKLKKIISRGPQHAKLYGSEHTFIELTHFIRKTIFWASVRIQISPSISSLLNKNHTKHTVVDINSTL